MTELTPELLLVAYSEGLFPMAQEDGQIAWYSPDPRAIIPLDRFHVPRSLQRVVRANRFEMRVNTAFVEVMRACARPAPGREATWINDELVAAYTRLHRLGFAHSLEAWREGRLVGGLYGVSLRGLFAGESMFTEERDASKVALVHLVQRLYDRGFMLLDTQFMTPHLQRFGTMEVSAAVYRRLLSKALQINATFDQRP